MWSRSPSRSKVDENKDNVMTIGTRNYVIFNIQKIMNISLTISIYIVRRIERQLTYLTVKFDNFLGTPPQPSNWIRSGDEHIIPNFKRIETIGELQQFEQQLLTAPTEYHAMVKC